MREIKIEVMFTLHNKDFTKSIGKHYTTVDRLIYGDDTFDYLNSEIVAKRQYIGKKDKGGVEVYDGDIVNVYHEDYPEDGLIGKVCWFDCYYPAFDIYTPSPRSKTGFESYSDEFNSFSCPDIRYKVIGNIHQNPELLQ